MAKGARGLYLVGECILYYAVAHRHMWMWSGYTSTGTRLFAMQIKADKLFLRFALHT